MEAAAACEKINVNMRPNNSCRNVGSWSVIEITLIFIQNLEGVRAHVYDSWVSETCNDIDKKSKIKRAGVLRLVKEMFRVIRGERDSNRDLKEVNVPSLSEIGTQLFSEVRCSQVDTFDNGIIVLFPGHLTAYWRRDEDYRNN